ncbi:MAG: hypothetical protein NVSMB32_09880 [Actinomycetota bacterium]
MMTTLDIYNSLRSAHQNCDGDALAGLYADDAQIIEYSHANPPSAPAKHSGRAEIDAHIKDIMARDMTHEVGDEVISDDCFSFRVACTYPSGQRVFDASTCRVREGKIVEKTSVVAWDA